MLLSCCELSSECESFGFLCLKGLVTATLSQFIGLIINDYVLQKSLKRYMLLDRTGP